MTIVASSIPQREIHQPLGDLVALGTECITKLSASKDHEAQLDRITAELMAICTAKPSRKRFVDCAKILSIYLRLLFLARAAGEAARVTGFESGVGQVLPLVRQDVYEAMAWEREQAAP